MASRLTSVALDLSRLPAPEVIEPLDAETLIKAFIGTFVPLYEARFGVTYDTSKIESEPAVILGEAFSWLRLLDRQRVNDAAKAVLLPFASGGNLDNLGSFFGVERAAGEPDAAFRIRLMAAPDAYAAAGPVAAYVYHARTASPLLVKDVGVRSPSPGAVLVSILSNERDEDGNELNGTASTGLLQVVRSRLNRNDIKPLTVDLSVQAAAVTEIDVALTIVVPSGPDPLLVKRNAEKAVRAYAAERHAVGRVWRIDGLVASARVPGVEYLQTVSPQNDIDPGYDGAVYMRSLTISVEAGG